MNVTAKNVMRKTKDLGFEDDEHIVQLYLVENNNSFFWLTKGEVGSCTIKPVSPKEVEEIYYLLGKNLLVRTSSVVRTFNEDKFLQIILITDLSRSTRLLSPKEIKDEKHSVIQLMNINRNGLLVYVEKNESGIKSLYAECSDAGPAGIYVQAVNSIYVDAITRMLESGVLLKSKSFEHYSSVLIPLKLNL